MGWAHERSARRGHLAQLLLGIPYFYRQFGYEYSAIAPRARTVLTVPPAPDDYDVRPAVSRDVPAMAALQDAAQASYNLRMPHAAECWRWLLAREGSITSR